MGGGKSSIKYPYWPLNISPVSLAPMVIACITLSFTEEVTSFQLHPMKSTNKTQHNLSRIKSL